MNIGRTGKYYYLRFIRLRGSPHSLSLGAAIGVFVGITPTIPFHTLVIFILSILTRSSFIAGLLTSWLVCNPLTYIPQYYLSLLIGNLATPYELNWADVKAVLDTVLSDVSFVMKMEALMNVSYEALVVMVVGGALLALPFTVLSYYLSYFTFVKIRKKRLEKRILS
jgi:uncharacterized protein (DUF2062 family)